MTRLAFRGNCGRSRSCLNRDQLSIGCAGAEDGEITQDARLLLLTDGLGDPGNECTPTDAFGFDSGRRCAPD